MSKMEGSKPFIVPECRAETYVTMGSFVAALSKYLDNNPEASGIPITYDAFGAGQYRNVSFSVNEEYSEDEETGDEVSKGSVLYISCYNGDIPDEV